MKIEHAKILTVLLGFTMLLSVFSPAVFAAETPGFELPVKVKLSGTPPTYNEDYKIILEADNPKYPMPNGSIGGFYTLTITGEGTVKFPEIQYSSIGIYTYKIYQLKGTNNLATYDDTKYHLVVYVTNIEGGSGLETTVLLYLVGEEGKLDEVIFENKYDRPSRPEEPETPDRSESPETPDPPPVDEPIPSDLPDSPPTDKPNVPKTGDDTVVWPYVGLFISGAAMLIMLGVTIKKNQINK